MKLLGWLEDRIWPQHAGIQTIRTLEISPALCMPLLGAKDRSVSTRRQNIFWSVHGVTAAKQYEIL